MVEKVTNEGEQEEQEEIEIPGAPMILITTKDGRTSYQWSGDINILAIDLDDVSVFGDGEIPWDALDGWDEVFPDLDDMIEEALSEHDRRNPAEKRFFEVDEQPCRHIGE